MNGCFGFDQLSADTDIFFNHLWVIFEVTASLFTRDSFPKASRKLDED